MLLSVKQLLKVKEFIISYLLTFLQEDLKTLQVLLKYETQTLNQCQTITLSTVSTFTRAAGYYVAFFLCMPYVGCYYIDILSKKFLEKVLICVISSLYRRRTECFITFG